MKVDCHYSKGFRFYMIDGVPYPSNTSIIKLLNKEKILDYNIRKTINYIVEAGNLSKATVSSAYSFYKRDLQRLADKGTEFHKMAADYLVRQKKVESPWLNKFIKWEQTSKFKVEPRLVERFLYNTQLRIAGTADFIGKIYDEWIGIDLKTASGIYNSHLIQCCGYDLMLKNSIKWGVLAISRDAKRKSFHILTADEKRTYTNVFLHLNQMFQELWKNGDLEVDVAY